MSSELPIQLNLVDLSDTVASALQLAFARYPEVVVNSGDILKAASNVVISPANSHGFMDGGVDRAYADFFGPGFANALRDAVLHRPEGHLPVGASMVVPTGHPSIRFVIVAPTMETPEHVPPQNAYRALRAALRLALSEPELRGAWFSPGLTTLVGQADPAEAAREMAEAYGDWKAWLTTL